MKTMIIGRRRALDAATPLMKLPTELHIDIGKLVLGSYQFNMHRTYDGNYADEKLS